jgi:hypothetical protein
MRSLLIAIYAVMGLYAVMQGFAWLYAKGKFPYRGRTTKVLVLPDGKKKAAVDLLERMRRQNRASSDTTLCMLETLVAEGCVDLEQYALKEPDQPRFAHYSAARFLAQILDIREHFYAAKEFRELTVKEGT